MKNGFPEEYLYLQESYPRSEVEKILDVYYLRLKLEKGDDLYITKYGVPYIENLYPENYFTDREWYASHSMRLSGTACTYKVRTKRVKEKQLDIVIKWNRMGQDIPGGLEIDDFYMEEFNSPFEEFSLVMEMRNTRYESPGFVITQRPLAIYVPSERVELWQSGRKEHKIKAKIEIHPDIVMDMFRPYIMIYKWVEGIDCAQAFLQGYMTEEKMAELTLLADMEMNRKGFLVKDRKPHHVIVRPFGEKKLLQDHNGKIRYAVVDYELLKRTPEREEFVKKFKRYNYLNRQRNRFVEYNSTDASPHLKHLTIFGVDYIFGHVESTNGFLWVVGNDPDLFDYFLPERWEGCHRTKISSYSEMYHVLTKDNINLVWKVSNVGMLPEVDPFRNEDKKVFEYGYNSPFEEVSVAVYLNRNGISTTFPRAIYMAGNPMNIHHSLSDERRFQSHKNLMIPDVGPVLRKDRTYVLIWGYWNGTDEMLAENDGVFYEGIDALNAFRSNLLSLKEYLGIMKLEKKRLVELGVEDLNLSGSHILLSLDGRRQLVRDADGHVDMRICNFEFLKTVKIP